MLSDRYICTKTTKKINQHLYDKKTTFCIVLVIQTIYLDRFRQYSTVSLIYICKNIFLNFTLNLNLQFVSKRSNGDFAMCIYICITALIQIIILKTRNRTFWFSYKDNRFKIFFLLHIAAVHFHGNDANLCCNDSFSWIDAQLCCFHDSFSCIDDHLCCCYDSFPCMDAYLCCCNNFFPCIDAYLRFLLFLRFLFMYRCIHRK